MLTALLREQVIRTVHSDGAAPQKVFSATFDIAKDNPADPTNSLLVWSGLRFMLAGGIKRLDIIQMPPRSTEIPLEYLCCGMDAFEALKW